MKFCCASNAAIKMSKSQQKIVLSPKSTDFLEKNNI